MLENNRTVAKRGNPLHGFTLLLGNSLLYRSFLWPVRHETTGVVSDRGNKDKACTGEVWTGCVIEVLLW